MKATIFTRSKGREKLLIDIDGERRCRRGAILDFLVNVLSHWKKKSTGQQSSTT